MTYTLLRRALFFFTLIVLGAARSYAQSYPNIAIETNPYDQHETAIAGHLTNANKPNRYSGLDPTDTFYQLGKQKALYNYGQSPPSGTCGTDIHI